MTVKLASWPQLCERRQPEKCMENALLKKSQKQPLAQCINACQYDMSSEQTCFCPPIDTPCMAADHMRLCGSLSTISTFLKCCGTALRSFWSF